MDSLGYMKDYLFKKYVNLYRNYEWTLTFADKRVADWPLMQSPTSTVALILLYLSTVYYGPQIMKNRKPFRLRWVLIFYNLSMTFLNLYIAVEYSCFRLYGRHVSLVILSVVSLFIFIIITVNQINGIKSELSSTVAGIIETFLFDLLICARRRNYNWACQLVDYTENPYEVRIAKALWWYYFSKLLEFCDTLFFILRKKNNQLSFLHVYHHSTMFGLWWIGVKWVAGGSALPGAMANSFVHVLMYSYYTLSALGPAIQPYLWWKKYLTVIQMIQFLSAMAMGIKAIYYNCQFTRWMQYALVAYSFSFIVLFGNFYCNSYSKKDIKEKKKK